jgi:hypothetical protein
MMTIRSERLRQEIRAETHRFALQFVLAMVAALGAGIAIVRFVQ